MTDVKVYHGTTVADAERFLRHGVRRSYPDDRNPWRTYSIGTGVTLHVSDTPEIARFYAAQRAYFDEDIGGAVLELNVRPDQMRVDKRAHQICLDSLGDCPRPSNWQESLALYGAAVVKGNVPATHVRLIQKVHPARTPRLADKRPLVKALAL